MLITQTYTVATTSRANIIFAFRIQVQRELKLELVEKFFESLSRFGHTGDVHDPPSSTMEQ